MSADPAAPLSLSVAYLLFNDGWDLVAGNRVTQTGEPLGPVISGLAVPRYLDYLASSLGSLARTHAPPLPARVWLVELDPAGLGTREVADFLARRVPEQPVEIAVVPHELVRPFVEEARAIPLRLYRAPNRLHEMALLYAVRQTTERFAALVDPHVVFLRSDACRRLVGALAERPERWAAAFLERPRQRPGGSTPVVQRIRMHSCFAAFDTERMRERFPFAPFLEASHLEARLAGLENAEAIAHYRRHLVLDNLSLPTEHLRSDFDEDRLLALDEIAAHYAEGRMLTVVSDELAHVKHEQPGSRQPLLDALAAAGIAVDSSDELQRLIAACR
jgi:hypothetical protein